MKILVTSILVLVINTLSVFFFNYAFSKTVKESDQKIVRTSTCGPQQDYEEVIVSEDFSWNSTLEEINRRAERLYKQGKRLKQRAFVEDEAIYLPIEVIGQRVKNIELQPRFIKSVRAHIEQALKRSYVDEIIFSDMGHSHFFIPKEFYQNELQPIPVSDRHKLYEKMLAHEQLKILYHTAEQLEMKTGDDQLIDDRHIQWRFYTRNLVGDNKAQGHLELIHQKDHRYNTAREYDEEYRYWGGGFYITANKNGCFPFEHNGEVYYFDLNLSGFSPANNTGYY